MIFKLPKSLFVIRQSLIRASSRSVLGIGTLCSLLFAFCPLPSAQALGPWLGTNTVWISTNHWNELMNAAAERLYVGYATARGSDLVGNTNWAFESLAVTGGLPYSVNAQMLRRITGDTTIEGEAVARPDDYWWQFMDHGAKQLGQIDACILLCLNNLYSHNGWVCAPYLFATNSDDRTIADSWQDLYDYSAASNIWAWLGEHFTNSNGSLGVGRWYPNDPTFSVTWSTQAVKIGELIYAVTNQDNPTNILCGFRGYPSQDRFDLPQTYMAPDHTGSNTLQLVPSSSWAITAQVSYIVYDPAYTVRNAIVASAAVQLTNWARNIQAFICTNSYSYTNIALFPTNCILSFWVPVGRIYQRLSDMPLGYGDIAEWPGWANSYPICSREYLNERYAVLSMFRYTRKALLNPDAQIMSHPAGAAEWNWSDATNAVGYITNVWCGQYATKYFGADLYYYTRIGSAATYLSQTNIAAGFTNNIEASEPFNAVNPAIYDHVEVFKWDFQYATNSPLW